MTRMLFILFCLFSCLAHAAIPDGMCQQHHCVAVVDAGSTGSRLHVYAYDLDEQRKPIQIEQIRSKKIKPGFASIEPDRIDAYLTNLFFQVPEQNIPVYFYATAGMRLLSDSRQKQHYKTLQHWFATQAQWSLREAKTISGKQEGLLGWLAVNYRVGALQSGNEPLVSVMDMGGASVQVAVPVEHFDSIDPNDLVSLNIHDRRITLFVHSFLGLGQTEVSHHYLNAANCFPHDYPLPNESTGHGDAWACQQDISRLINSVHDVNHQVSPVVMANPNTLWYAMSGLGTLVKNKPFHFQNNQFTSRDMLVQADSELCRQSWLTLGQKFPDNDYTFINCLSSAYYYGLMVNGYGLSQDTLIHFLSDEDEPDWTLGAVLQYA
jgi:hypothetical protein